MMFDTLVKKKQTKNKQIEFLYFDFTLPERKIDNI